MNTVFRVAGTVALSIGISFAMVSCSSLPAVKVSKPSPSTPAPVELSTLEHYVPPGMTILASADSMTGDAEEGTFAVTTKNVFIYLTCRGSGVIYIDAENIGKFPLDCSDSTAPAPSTNNFDVSHVRSYSVAVKAQPDQIWALTVAIEK